VLGLTSVPARPVISISKSTQVEHYLIEFAVINTKVRQMLVTNVSDTLQKCKSIKILALF
jgi:hypothetical protein